MSQQEVAGIGRLAEIEVELLASLRSGTGRPRRHLPLGSEVLDVVLDVTELGFFQPPLAEPAFEPLQVHEDRLDLAPDARRGDAITPGDLIGSGAGCGALSPRGGDGIDCGLPVGTRDSVSDHASSCLAPPGSDSSRMKSTAARLPELRSCACRAIARSSRRKTSDRDDAIPKYDDCRT